MAGELVRDIFPTNTFVGPGIQASEHETGKKGNDDDTDIAAGFSENGENLQERKSLHQAMCAEPSTFAAYAKSSC